MKINRHLIFNYFSIFIGFIFILYYIWFRFLRERLPRDIPFHLTPFSFITLIIICITYIFLLYKIFKLYKKDYNNSYILYIIFSKLKVLFKPFILLHNFLIIELNLNYYFIKIFYYIIKNFTLYNEERNLKFLLIFDFTPKILILLVFISDIIYFKNLNIFYYFIILGLIPLLYNYCIYISRTCLEFLLQKLEQYYYIEILTTIEEEKVYRIRTGLPLFMCYIDDLKYNDYGYLDLRYFVEWQAQNYIFEYDLYKYTYVKIEFAQETYAKKHNITFSESYDIFKEFEKYFFENIEQAVHLQAFIEVHKDITKPFIMKKHLLIILIGYLIGWIYILIVSFHTLNLVEFVNLLNTIIDIKEPFSGLYI